MKKISSLRAIVVVVDEPLTSIIVRDVVEIDREYFVGVLEIIVIVYGDVSKQPSWVVDGFDRLCGKLIIGNVRYQPFDCFSASSIGE